ncbi:unnamed protein product [Effrenium voratum]|nr:unnamed protein product [Effrenium voratum]
MPLIDVLGSPDALCSEKTFTKIRAYRLLVSLMRQSARQAPFSLSFLRTFCDLGVPTALVRWDVKQVPDLVTIKGGDGKDVQLKLEWVLPRTGDESALTSFACCGAGFAKLWPSSIPRTPKMQPNRRVVLYLHGGAYLLCTPASLRIVTFNVAAALQAPMCVPEYRRPPEHPIPGPMEDVLEVYRHLLARHPDADLVLAGDSAGGGIAAALLAKLRETDLPMPRFCVLISPWTDLGENGMRHATMANEPSDFLPGPLVAWCAEKARGGSEHDDWCCSPMHAPGSLDNLPPILVVYGEDELLRGQITEFCSVWQSKGAPITSLGVEGGVHAPVLFQDVWQPAADALTEMSRFADQHSSPV